MSSNLLNPGNVKVYIGEPLSKKSSDMTSYQFEIISFNTDIKTQVYEQQISDIQVRKTLEEYSSILYIQNIDFALNNEKPDYIDVSWEIIKKYPSANLTRNSSIIPTPLLMQKDSSRNIKNKIYSRKPTDQYYENHLNQIVWVASKGTNGGANTICLNKQEIEKYQYQRCVDFEAYNVLQKQSFAFLLKLNYTKKSGYAILTINNDLDKEIDLQISGNNDNILSINKNVSKGSLIRSSGYNLKQVKENNDLKDSITIFVYPLFNCLNVTSDLSGSIKQNNVISAKIDVKAGTPLSNTSPTIAEFPSKFKDGITSINIKTNSLYKSTNYLEFFLQDCFGQFAYCPLSFVNKSVFRYYFKGSQKKIQGQTLTYYACPLFFDNGSEFVANEMVIAKRDEQTKSQQSAIYHFQFYIEKDDKFIQQKKSNSPGQMFGFIKILKRTGKFTDVLNQNGSFNIPNDQITSLVFSKYDVSYTSWVDFISNVSITTGLDNINGSITLDKYAIDKQISKIPNQHIGALTLKVKNDNYDGTIFTGFALQTSTNLTQSNATMTVNLQGTYKKLQDMKLINCPFWDGDKLEDILKYFTEYTGIDCEFGLNGSWNLHGSSYFKVPAGYNYQSPRINFTLGTTCLQALRQLAQMCNLQLVIQPDGKLYWYQMNEYGLPYWVDKQTEFKMINFTEIIDFNMSPYLTNKFNTFVTLGYVKNNESSSDILKSNMPTIPAVFIDKFVTSGTDANFPWSRLKITPIQGFLTVDQIKSQHDIYCKFGRANIWSGNVTVLGRTDCKLYDVIKIGDLTQKFYIHNIQQNIDLNSKNWTTSLSLGVLDV